MLTHRTHESLNGSKALGLVPCSESRTIAGKLNESPTPRGQGYNLGLWTNLQIRRCKWWNLHVKLLTSHNSMKISWQLKSVLVAVSKMKPHTHTHTHTHAHTHARAQSHIFRTDRSKLKYIPCFLSDPSHPQCGYNYTHFLDLLWELNKNNIISSGFSIWNIVVLWYIFILFDSILYCFTTRQKWILSSALIIQDLRKETCFFSFCNSYTFYFIF